MGKTRVKLFPYFTRHTHTYFLKLPNQNSENHLISISNLNFRFSHVHGKYTMTPGPTTFLLSSRTMKRVFPFQPMCEDERDKAPAYLTSPPRVNARSSELSPEGFYPGTASMISPSQKTGSFPTEVISYDSLNY